MYVNIQPPKWAHFGGTDGPDPGDLDLEAKCVGLRWITGHDGDDTWDDTHCITYIAHICRAYGVYVCITCVRYVLHLSTYLYHPK